MIVLHESQIKTGSFESALIIGLGKKTAMVAKFLRRDDPDVRDLG